MTNLFTILNQEEDASIDINEQIRSAMENPVPGPVTHTVYIPSKGRPDCNLTSGNMKSIGIRYFVVVEPQDYDTYCKHHGDDKILKLPKNDQGIVFVRNWIKEYSKSQNESHHWQLDDDLKCFKIRPDGAAKNHKCSPSFALSIVEQSEKQFSNIAISGLTSSVFAFSKKAHVIANRLAYGCVLVKNDIPVMWRRTAEDWDYSLQILASGQCSLIFNHIMFDTPATQTMSGGNTEILFAGDKRKELYNSLIELWPGRFRLKEFPDRKKNCRLIQTRRFFNDYRQQLIPVNNNE